MLKYCVLDCYVDEPACFGVPPFISPYPRYINGALIDAGIDPSQIDYLTIDALRAHDYRINASYDMVFLIGGAVVPGKYLGSKIGSAAEINRIIERNERHTFAVGGLISRIMPKRDNSIPVLHDIEKFAFLFARGTLRDERRSVNEIARWAVLGATIVHHHPRFPDVICEVETSRGCPRESHCSFCSEGLYGPTEFRAPEHITEEIDALINAGISRFRLGRQADILQYQSNCTTFMHGFPTPIVAPLRDLLLTLRRKKEKGSITVLNIDNANPGTIAHFPEESAQLLEVLTESVTPGDTLALGIESFDEEVVRRNNLKVNSYDAIKAITIINSIGAKRVNDIPLLLPGINLIHGLAGETANTFETNYRCLSEIMDRGLLVKRINIRQLLPFPGTPLYDMNKTITKSVENRFRYYREKIRSDIEHFMLKEIYPIGTIIRGCQILETRNEYSYGKQIASYSITLKIPQKLRIHSFYDAVIIGHRERSLDALVVPIPINALPQKAIEMIPGIGKKRATEIILNRPYKDIQAALRMFEGVDENIKNKLSLD